MAWSWHHARMRWPIVLLTIAVGLVPSSDRSLQARQPDLRWEPLTSGVTARLRGVSAVNDQVAWASGERGTVLLTTDGGRSWQSRVPAGGEGYDAIILARDRSVLLASGAGGRLARVAVGR